MKRTLLILSAALTLAGCYDTTPPAGTVYRPAAPVERAEFVDYGTIIEMRPVTMQRDGNGDQVIGAVTGGLVGAVIGHQFGSGTGKDLMTGAGAIAGAMVGSKVAAQAQTQTYTSSAWTVRLDNGQTMTVIQASNAFRVGQRVSVVHRNGEVYLR